jgi:ribonucleoside-diphosphate reductase alpha chain
MEEVAKRGVVHDLPGVPEDVQRVFVTAHEVPFDWHVRHQGVFQKSTDNGVSKTINLPNSASMDDVARAYLLAWELGCLGITVFRDGCKEGVLHVGTKGAKGDKRGEAPTTAPTAVVKPRPRSLTGRTYRVETPLGTAYTVVNEHGDGEPFEVFVSVGKAGSDTMAVAEAMGRLISLALRMPSPLSPKRRLEEIVAQLSGIGGGRPLGFGPQRVLSLPDGIARVLAEHLGHVKVETEASGTAAAKLVAGDFCPECGQATFVYEEGCKKCYGCGFNEC